MANATVMWVIGILLCAGAFLNGVRFARMTKNPWADKSFFGMPIEGADMSIQKIRLFGKIQMICALLFLIFWTLMLFGVLGPVEGMQTVDLK
jgi:hypothetical protein